MCSSNRAESANTLVLLWPHPHPPPPACSYGSALSAVQLLLFCRADAAAFVSGTAHGGAAPTLLALAFLASQLAFYAGSTFCIQLAGAAVLNLSLLAANAWAALLRIGARGVETPRERRGNAKGASEEKKPEPKAQLRVARCSWPPLGRRRRPPLTPSADASLPTPALIASCFASVLRRLRVGAGGAGLRRECRAHRGWALAVHARGRAP